MFLSLCTPAIAEETAPKRTIVSATTAAERDAIFEKEVSNVIAALSADSKREVRYHYRTVNLTSAYNTATVGDYAGNQPAKNGYRFPTGGGFYFSDNGGPTATGSIGLNLPAPFDVVSFSVTLGVRSAVSGLIVNVPNTTDSFKLYVEKTIEARPYKVERRRTGSGNEWKFDSYGVVYVTVGVTAYAKKV